MIARYTLLVLVFTAAINQNKFNFSKNTISKTYKDSKILNKK